MLRGSYAGGTSPLARLIAVVLLIGMIGVSVPVLVPVFRWIIGLL